MSDNNENPKRQSQPPRGFSSIFSQFSRSPLNGDSEHERLEEVRKLIADCIRDSMSDDYEIHVVPVTDAVLALPALAICLNKKDACEKGIGVHTLIIEPAVYELPPRQGMSFQGQPSFVIDRVPGEVIDSIYIETVMKTVREEYAGNDYPLREAGFRVIWSDTELVDKKTVYAIAADAVQAASQAIAPYISPDSSELRFDAVDRDVRFSLDIEAGHSPHFSIQGTPVRSDVRLRLTMAMPPMRGQQGPNRENKMEFGTVHGFFDIIPLTDSKFLPRFVITELALAHAMPNSVSAQMLLLTMATTLVENGRWMDTFLRSVNILSHRDLKHIHPHLSGAPEPEQAIRLMKERFAGGLVFSMDCPLASDSSWRYDVWAAGAHSPSPAGVTAVRTIVEAANILTAGRFDKNHEPSSSMLVTENNVILMGYYIGSDGGHHDLRDLDDLMVATLTERDPDMLDAWRDTHMRVDLPLDLRIHKRRQITSAVLGKVHYQDTATRVSFGGEFLSGLQESLRDVGLAVSMPPETMAKPKATYSWDTVVGGDASQSGLFREPYNGQQGPSFSNRPRWQ
jgi:hypothetical protein